MSIPDWLKTINEKNREKWRQEGYKMGYKDASEGKPLKLSTPPTELSKKE